MVGVGEVAADAIWPSLAVVGELLIFDVLPSSESFCLIMDAQAATEVQERHLRPHDFSRKFKLNFAASIELVA